MSGKTVTRADLYQAIYQKVGLSRTQSAALVELVLKEITDCLERGETVKLSSFGLFVVRKCAARARTGMDDESRHRRSYPWPYRGGTRLGRDPWASSAWH
jgi:nucleoid DNA-binding protein